ncbi:MAG: hypothetical protein GEV08_23245 [Acidimicrobiia bacterium]|nr:hypothetical protein [Acidimicrobiia bacterium]
MKNRVVGFALAGVLGLAGLGLLLSSGDDDGDRVDAAAGTAVTNAAGAPAQLAAAKDDDGDPIEMVGIPAPPELATVTLQLEPQRALGGLVNAGELVAVTASFDRSQTPGAATDAGPQSGVILEKILVTAVQVEEPAGDGEDPTPPRGTLLVTLAVPPAEAPKLVFAAEYGRVWLAGEEAATPATGRAPANFASVNAVPAP